MATTGTPRRTGSTPAPARTPSQPRTGTGNGRNRRPPRRKRHPFWQGLITLFQAGSLLVLVAIITFSVALYTQLRNAPSTIDITFDPPGQTLIYSSDGTLLAKMYVENRQIVPIDRIPKDLQNATVAFEDKRFYTHSGIDIQGIVRALGRNLKSGDLKGEGGSTLTQQLARNMGIEGLGREKTVGRKLHEMMIAAQIEKNYTKQAILEMYLNQVNYGSGAYGVQTAAKTYFGKDVQDLDLAQCALLAGLPNRPRDVSPYKDKTAAHDQRSRVLHNMLEQHYISPEQFAQADNEFIHLAAPKPPKQGSQIFHAAYFVNYVADQIQKVYGRDYLKQGNLRVYTTLNWPMQQIAEEAVASGIERVRGRGPNQGALVALDTKTGEIKAMVGGLDYSKSNFNIAAYARRQPGSSFKAVVYSAAIDSGVVNEYTPAYDGPVSYSLGGGKSYRPRDDNGYRYGSVSLREAMAQSINVPAVKTLKLIGAQSVVRYARVMGVDSPLSPVLSLALGSSGVTPLEMADVYATIANGGNHPVPTAFTRLTDAQDHTILFRPHEVDTSVLKADTVRQVSDMLRAVVTEGTAVPAHVVDVPDAHGKTGTTQGHKDVWFVGYDTNLSVAVWAGHPMHNAKTGQDSYGEEMEGNAWGSTVCAPIWRDFMLKAVPIFKVAQAKEAAHIKPAMKPAPAEPAVAVTPLPADTRYQSRSERRKRRERRRLDAAAAAQTDTTANTDTSPPSDSAPSDSSATSAPEFTSPSGPDTNTGLSAPPPTDTAPAPAQAAPPQSVPRPRRRVSPPPDTGSASSASASPASAPPIVHRERAKPAPEYVTVRVNPEDGLKATQWTPEVVERTYVKGAEPHRYSRMYGPPPGEH